MFQSFQVVLGSIWKRGLGMILALSMGWGFLFAEELIFNNLTVTDGLPSNLTSCIAQDSDGFIWIGTHDGLCRYDGQRFITFRHDNGVSSVPSNQISAILADEEFLWIGTWGGLCRMNCRNFQVEQVSIGKDNAVRVLYKSTDGMIWIGTANGLYGYQKSDHSIIYYSTANSSISHNTIRSIYQTQNGDLWVGTYDKLNRLRNNRFVAFDVKGEYNPLLKNNLICAIQSADIQDDSHLWIGTETGLCYFNCMDGHYQRFSEWNAGFSNDVVKCIFRDGERIWLGTDFGLNIFQPSTHRIQTFYHHPEQTYSLANNVIWDIMEDRNGLIWLVTANGITYTSRHQSGFVIHEINHLNGEQKVGNQIKSIFSSQNDDIWLATVHGLIKQDQNTGKRTVFTTSGPVNQRLLLNNVFALEEDSLHRIWIGTAGGINIWDESRNCMYAIASSKENGLNTNYISKLMKDARGRFWVSAWEGGLYLVDGDLADLKNLRFKKVHPLGSDKFICDGQYIWFPYQNGLWRMSTESFEVREVRSLSASLLNSNVECLFLTQDKRILIGIKNRILVYNQESEQVEEIVTGDLNSQNQVIAIQTDLEGNIWASTYNSILLIGKGTSDPYFIPLNKGLPLKSFYTNCSARTREGKILFGGDNGYVEIQPSRYTPSVKESPVYITHIEVNNQPLQSSEMQEVNTCFLKEMELDATQKALLFEFASLDFAQPGMNRYAYQLEGFDNQWNYTTGDRNFAVYSNLPAGKYRFLVKGSNNNGIWNDEPSVIKLTVHPPLWLSRWYIMLYMIILVVVAYVILRIYTFRIRLLNELKISRLETEHSEAIALSKQQFFTNVSHELRTPLSLIISPVNEVLSNGQIDDKSRKLLNLAQKNTRRLLWLVNQILDFRKMEVAKIEPVFQSVEIISFCHDLYEMFEDHARKLNINFSFQHNVSNFQCLVDKDKISIVIFNLLSNAFKFTREKGNVAFTVEVRHDGDRQYVVFQVMDDGCGILPEETERIFERFYQTPGSMQKGMGSGIGLTIAREYIHLHHGTIQVSSIPDCRTTFTAVIPVMNPEKISNDSELNHAGLSEVELSGSVASSVSKTGVNKPVILVVDDNPDILSLIEMSLVNNFQIMGANNGDEGLMKAKKYHPDVIISDVMMPGLDGISFCHQIRKNPETNHIPFVLLTARNQVQQQIEGIQSGADHYITKPFDISHLSAVIEQILQRQKELEDYFKKELVAPDYKVSDEQNVDSLFMKKVMAIIQQNLANEQLSVEMISDLMGLSSTHLYRKLKGLTNLSTNEIIKKYRIKTAAEMLKNNEGNIAEIMYKVGFSNSSYFSKCFKAEFGVTPSEFQQQ